uniref:Uncharacterized protein n=1 Tax=Schistocephalus solidus TaxID=70667 RepID=A0A0X3NZ96_SCHSO
MVHYNVFLRIVLLVIDKFQSLSNGAHNTCRIMNMQNDITDNNKGDCYGHFLLIGHHQPYITYRISYLRNRPKYFPKVVVKVNCEGVSTFTFGENFVRVYLNVLS